MSHTTDPRLLVLHGLKLKGFAEPDAVAAVVGLKQPVVASTLTTLVEGGHAIRRDGRISGFALTPAGRSEHAAGLKAEMEAVGHRELVTERYQEFLLLNGRLLTVCTAWQVRDLSTNTLNDHADKVYDEDVIEQLGTIHDGVGPICHSLAGALVRYQPYHGRFVGALRKVRKGQQEWFAKPIIDSYHTVWMEMHEDLLATLAIARASEAGH